MTTTARTVSPSKIQEALNQIWESLETTKVTRACLFNLIFYTKRDERLPYIKTLAEQVVRRFPSRILFVITDEEVKEPSLKTEVSILGMSPGHFDVACDYIQIEASSPSLEQVPFLLLAHILPDLPVYLLLAKDPCVEDPLCKEIGQLADRLIFDSETTEDLPRFAACLLEQQKQFQLDVADLNWARLEGYRDLFSMTFHDEERLHQIRHAKRIHICYNAKESSFFCHTRTQAIYFQAWLASQLGWEWAEVKQEGSSLLFIYKRSQGLIEVVLSMKEAKGLPPGLILSVELLSDEEQSFLFKHNLDHLHQISFQRTTKEQCDLPLHYPFTKQEGGHSLVKEICHRGTSAHFLNTLRFLAQMEGASLC